MCHLHWDLGQFESKNILLIFLCQQNQEGICSLFIISFIQMKMIFGAEKMKGNHIADSTVYAALSALML